MDIKKVIQSHGWTLERLAAEMTNKQGERGVTQATVSQIINGNPSLDKLKEIAGIIGVSVSELVKDENQINGYIEVKGELRKVTSVEELEGIVNKIKGE